MVVIWISAPLHLLDIVVQGGKSCPSFFLAIHFHILHTKHLQQLKHKTITKTKLRLSSTLNAFLKKLDEALQKIIRSLMDCESLLLLETDF